MGTGAGLGIMAASSLASGISEGEAARAQGDFAAAQGEANAKMAELQASEVEKKGQKDASIFRRKGRGQIGAQKAALAAQGIDIGSGTAAEQIEESGQFLEEDASRIRMNAIREAYGLKTEAINLRTQGQFDQIAGKAKQRSSLLTGGLKAAGYGAEGYAKYREANPLPKVSNLKPGQHGPVRAGYTRKP
jgi:hypothetical protein